MLSHRLENSVGTDDVCVDEWAWVANGIIIVALGGEMHDDISIGYEFVHEFSITDITGDEFYLIEDGLEIVGVARIGQFIDNGYFIFRPVLKGVMDKIRSDEPRAAANMK